jgi:predicted nuclease of predicted toxin-antitoxin system
MRFLADMGISMRTVRWLKQAGHDAVHLSEQGLQRLPDDEILVKARIEDRIVLTLDLDFGYLLAVSGEQLPSVILFRLDNQSSEIVNERLAEVLTQCEAELKAGAIVSVNEEAIRLRSLPI